MSTLAQLATPRSLGHQPIVPIHPINYATSTTPAVKTDTAEPTPWWAVARAVGPLILVNGLAVYGQLAYVYDHVAPHGWNQASRIALAIGAASAVESIALYVGWHAHDALLLKAYATARNLRRASYLIAGLVASVNYAHFAGKGLAPTAAGVMFGLVSLVSPWLWGLHSRRAQRIQLTKERKVDEAGAEFSTERRRHFPIRTWAARRWSIDHGVTDPREAWVGYNAHREAEAARTALAQQVAAERKAAAKAAKSAHAHTPAAGSAQPVEAPKPTPAHRRTPNRKPAPSKRRQPTRRPAQPTEASGMTPTAPPADAPTVQQPTQPTSTPTVDAQPNDGISDGISDLQRQRLADLAREFPGDLPGRDKVMAHMRAQGYDGWSSKVPAQALIDLLRAQREAQPTTPNGGTS